MPYDPYQLDLTQNNIQYLESLIRKQKLLPIQSRTWLDTLKNYATALAFGFLGFLVIIFILQQVSTIMMTRNRSVVVSVIGHQPQPAQGRKRKEKTRMIEQQRRDEVERHPLENIPLSQLY